MNTLPGALASVIRPVSAYLPSPAFAAKVVAPPYDDLTPEQARRTIADNPLSFLNLLRSEIDAPEQSQADRLAMLHATAAWLRELLAGDIFDFYPGPVFFVCRLESDGHAQTGVIADVALDAYNRGLVKVHESTRRGQEDRLVEYMNVVCASFLPVFLIHRPASAVDEVIAVAVGRQPVLDVEAEDGLHLSVWVVDDGAEVARLREALERLDALYVADGHHRLAAAVRSAAARAAENPGHTRDEPYTSVTSVLFASDQLVIHPYNRCVKDLGGRSARALLEAISSRFEVRDLPGATAPMAGEISTYIDSLWHLIALPARTEEAGNVSRLDVTVLHDDVLRPLFHIEDPRSDPRIEFVPGTLGLAELERLCNDNFAAGFALHPMAVDDLIEVADRGERMPPKSTWFAPKLRSGLVVRLL